MNPSRLKPTYSHPHSNLFAFLIVVLVLTGFSMRFYNLGEKSFWADELFTMRMAMYHPLVPQDGQPWFRRINVNEIGDGDSFLTAKAGEQSPPLQDLLEKATVQWLGSTEFAARLPGAVASCLLLAWFGWFALKFQDTLTRRTLSWSLLFLVFSPSLVLYAQDARAYSLGASLLGMVGLLWMIRWRRGWRHWSAPGWGEIALFTLASYTHYNAALLVVLMLGCDAAMATVNRSWLAWRRLLVVGAFFGSWLIANAHTILFTTGGGVAWGQRSTSWYVLQALVDASAALYGPWLLLGFILAWSFLCYRLLRRSKALPAESPAMFFLCSLIVVYLVLAATVAAKAGMANPRYYLFIVPAFAVAMGMLFSRLSNKLAVACAVISVAFLSAPTMQSSSLYSYEEFRGMTEAAVSGTDKETVFLYPWVPNREMYRVYLDRMRGVDSRANMIGVSFPGEVPQVCEKLKHAKHVVVVSHDSGHSRINEVYAACGSNWPLRESNNFHNTFSEHWRVAPGATNNYPAQ